MDNDFPETIYAIRDGRLIASADIADFSLCNEEAPAAEYRLVRKGTFVNDTHFESAEPAKREKVKK